MFEGLRCKHKGHLFVDSRSIPGTTVCVRCRHRQSFDGATITPPEKTDTSSFRAIDLSPER